LGLSRGVFFAQGVEKRRERLTRLRTELINSLARQHKSDAANSAYLENGFFKPHTPSTGYMT
jgi:hypothetical protein